MTVGVDRGYKKPGDPPFKPNPLGQLWHETQRPPWVLKAKRRRANKIASESRRRNR